MRAGANTAAIAVFRVTLILSGLSRDIESPVHVTKLNPFEATAATFTTELFVKKPEVGKTVPPGEAVTASV